MNRTKLNIKTSKNKNLKYNIYKSTSIESLPKSLESLQLMIPIMIVDEATSEYKITTINEIASLDSSYVRTTNMIKYLLKYRPIKTSANKINISINFNDEVLIVKNESILLDITFDDLGVITSVVKTNRDKTTENVVDIINIISIEEDTLKIDGNLIEGNYSISCIYNTEIIEVVDMTSNGIANPNSIVEYKSYTSDNVSIPYVKITPELSDKGVVYYYRIVAIDITGNVSNSSLLVSNHLIQKKDLLSYNLQSSKDYFKNKELATWNDLSVVPSDTCVMIGRKVLDQPGFISLSDLSVIEDINIFAPSDISTNLSYVKSDNKLLISIPNVWVCNSEVFNSRPNKAYRLKAIINKEESEYGEVIFKENNSDIEIEKMIVIKRNCTLEATPSDASSVNQLDTTVINTFIRKNGIYYTEEDHGKLSYNIPFPYSDVTIMSKLSVFDKITITDISCISGQKYNYSIYLYDSFKNISNPIVIVVET